MNDNKQEKKSNNKKKMKRPKVIFSLFNYDDEKYKNSLQSKRCQFALYLA